jgi:aminoglycoside phosphotransferase (APT) family kinase protein
MLSTHFRLLQEQKNRGVYSILKYTVIERAADTSQQPVSLEQICAMCERAFGQGKEIEAVQELGGGEYNNTYLITFVDAMKVILRVAPAPDGLLPGRGIGLMRNEHYFQPFFAPLAALMPKTLLADFTHQLIDRDYMFQTFMEGERWVDIGEQLSPAENTVLWQQLGQITKSIHSIEGEIFGSPILGSVSPRWSELVLDELDSIIEPLEEAQIDASDIKTVRELAEQHSELLDEIQQPRLLHGDLWTFNVLIKRDQGNPRISAILDADGCSWGDPMSDWTMFLLHVKTTEGKNRNEIAGAPAFWQAYGQPERTRGALFREQIYRARPFAGARLDHHLERREDRVRRTYKKLREIIDTIRSIV